VSLECITTSLSEERVFDDFKIPSNVMTHTSSALATIENIEFNLSDNPSFNGVPAVETEGCLLHEKKYDDMSNARDISKYLKKE